MALGDSYATLAEIRSRVGITDAGDTTDDARLTAALAVASRGIEKVCARQFNDAGSATARLYRPYDEYRMTVDDFSTVTGLVIASDTADNGTYSTTWTNSDYELEPLNGIVDDETGWPYSIINAINAYTFLVDNARASLRVTARWGWSAVPSPIKEATLVVATEIFKLKDAPFGVAGYGDYGPIRVRANPMAMGMIAPYRRYPLMVA